tara:strand:+ start:137 stop:265 length:129 start_codon:yes stop_codon:yes gene_type:complete
MWFNPKKIIPNHILNKGCKFYKETSTTKLVGYIIKVFEGEII